MEPIPSYAGLKIKEKRKVKIDRPCNVAVSEGINSVESRNGHTNVYYNIVHNSEVRVLPWGPIANKWIKKNMLNILCAM